VVYNKNMPTKLKEKVVAESTVVQDSGLLTAVKPEPEETLLEWKAPIRVYKKRGKQFWTTTFTMAFLVGVIFFFIEGWMPVAVLIAFLFLLYVMSSVPPEEIDIKITTRGVSLGGSKYFWGEMVRFWTVEQWGQKVVNVDIGRLPGRLMFLVGPMKEEQIKEVMSKYLTYEVAKPSVVEKASEWLGKKIPFEVE
jgi:hypothetical protein